MRAILIAVMLLGARTARANGCVATDAAMHSARIGSDSAVVCYNDPPPGETASCWRLDYATRHWKAADEPAAAPDAKPPVRKVALATRLRVCAPECRDVTLPGVATLTADDVAESADRSLLAVHGPANAKDDPIHVLDAATGALRATIHPWKTEMGDPPSIRRVAFVGSALYVTASASPVSDEGRLYDPRTGRQLATVGGQGAMVNEAVALDLGGNRWAFAAFDSGELYVHDVTTGKRLPPIRSGPKDGGGYSAIQLAGKLLVGVRDTATAGVMVYDIGTRKASQHTVPACK